MHSHYAHVINSFALTGNEKSLEFLALNIFPVSFYSFMFTDQKRSCSKSPDVVSQGGYATNFGAGLGGGGTRGIEGQIMASVFKALVTRLVKSTKELKAQENMVR